MKPSVILMTSLLACLGTVAAAAAHAAPARPPGKSCHLPGAEEALRCLTVKVPLDYANKGGAGMPLHVTVAHAFRESARPDPLFVLAGGPGQAGSDVLPILQATFRRVRATRDVVFIDQRGTGLSGRLGCPHEKNEESLTDAQLEAAMVRCIEQVNKPFAAYSTANAAHDIEQVRLALGYDSINVLGASYGTRLAQHYARLYPNKLRALILDGVAAPDQAIPAADRDGAAALERTFADCAADKACNGAFPELRKEYAALLARVAPGLTLEVPDPRTARPTKVTFTTQRLRSAVHNILYSPQDSRRLPFLIHSAYNNRWQPLIARQNTAADFSPDGPVSALMHLAVVCAEDVPRVTASSQIGDNTLDPAGLERYQALCRVMKVAPAPAPATTPIKAPALLLSGALDPVTPPRRAEAAARFMPASQHLVVANAGHGIISLGCAPRLMREFLDQPQQKVKADCLDEIPAATFQLGSAGPQP